MESAIRLVLATVLLVAASSKIQNHHRFLVAVRSWGLVPRWALSPMSWGIPLVESAVASRIFLSFVGSAAEPAAGLAPVLLFAALSGGQIVIHLSGRPALSGCAGGAGRLGRKSLARAVVCMTLAVAALPLPPP